MSRERQLHESTVTDELELLLHSTKGHMHDPGIYRTYSTKGLELSSPDLPTQCANLY